MQHIKNITQRKLLPKKVLPQDDMFVQMPGSPHMILQAQDYLWSTKVFVGMRKLYRHYCPMKLLIAEHRQAMIFNEGRTQNQLQSLRVIERLYAVPSVS